MSLNSAKTPNAPPGRSESAVLWPLFFLYLVLTLVATWPLFRNPWVETFRMGGDTYLNIWTLGWDAHAFLSNPLGIFDANIYYPERNTLAFSENLIGCALFAAPFIWLADNLVFGLNVITVLPSALCGLGTCLLGRRLGMRWPGAIVAGLVFAFTPPRFYRLAQPHLNSIQWIPFSLAFLHAYLDGGRRRDLWLAVGFFSLQALTSGHGGVLLALALAALIAWRLLLGERMAPLGRVKDFGLPGLLLLLPSVLVVLPYISVRATAGMRRDVLGDIWRTTWESFLESPAHLHQFLISLAPGLQINERSNAALFPGLTALLLAAVVLWPRRARAAAAGAAGEEGGAVEGAASGGAARSEPATGWKRLAALLATACLVFAGAGLAWFVAQGPFKWRVGGAVLMSAETPWRLAAVAVVGLLVRWRLRRAVPLAPGIRRAWRRRALYLRAPLPFYTLLMVVSLAIAVPQPYGLWRFVYWWPGFNFLRAPVRLTLLAVLGLAVLAGLGLDRISAKLSSRRRLVLATVVGMAVMADCLAVPLKVEPFGVELPPVDRWLDSRPKPFVVAEFPVPASRGTGFFENYQGRYMYHSTAHWQKTIHGYSGFRTPLHETLYDLLATFPDEAGVRRLKELGVTYVVVHTAYYPRGQWPREERRFAALSDHLRLVHVDGEGRVYALTN